MPSMATTSSNRTAAFSRPRNAAGAVVPVSRASTSMHAKSVPVASKPSDSLTTRGNLYGLAVLSSTRGTDGSRGIWRSTK